MAGVLQQGQIKRQAFKTVYVANMQALAAEQTVSFSRWLANLGATWSVTSSCNGATSALVQLTICMPLNLLLRGHGSQSNIIYMALNKGLASAQTFTFSRRLVEHACMPCHAPWQQAYLNPSWLLRLILCP